MKNRQVGPLKRNAKLIRNKYLEFFIPTVLTAMATNFAAIVDGGIVGNLIDSTADGVEEVLRILQTAPREPRRSNNTDVRVCREETGYSVRIKHSGARLCVGDFSALAKKFTSFSYSQAIGFSQIRF